MSTGESENLNAAAKQFLKDFPHIVSMVLTYRKGGSAVFVYEEALEPLKEGAFEAQDSSKKILAFRIPHGTRP